MFLRYWRGWTTEENADLYDEIVREVLAGIAAREVAGYRGAYLARRELGDETEFFDSTESVRAFAGDDYEIAYVPRQARALYKNGRCRAAQRYSRRALRFGTEDLDAIYHRSLIERCLGNESASRRFLARLREINRHYLDAPPSAWRIRR